MKFKQKKTNKITLSDKIADALTVKPRADIEDDEVFGTKPQTLSRAEFSSSDSENETAISEFRKRNVNLLSEISKKYEGKVVSRKDVESSSHESSVESDVQHDDKHDHLSSKNSISSAAVKNFRKLTKLNDSVDSEDSDSEEPNSISAAPSSGQSESDSDKGSEDDGESDDYSITQFKKQLENDDESAEESGDDNEEEEQGFDMSQMETPLKENFEHVKKQDVSEEAKKGASVRNQLLVWENLLEMRIHLQRCMNTANQMPMPATHKQLKQMNQFDEECKNTKLKIANTLDKFMQLQNVFLKNYPETKNLLSSKDDSSEDKGKDKEVSDEEILSDTDNEEIPSDTEEDEPIENKKTPAKQTKQVSKKRKLEEYEADISRAHKAFRTFRDTTIQKWNDKTRLGSAANIKNAPTNTILQQISYILSDREKLLRRTQLKRSEYDIVGYIKPNKDENEEKDTDLNHVNKDRKYDDEYIPEIFDDSDFYHQLLRELIECKSADISDPVQLSRQWIALQQMRSKMKRKVDTKATKGRKIKYVVHNKLVNYMGPEKSTTWNEESTNELYSSLFGKMFEHNNVGVNSNGSTMFKIKS